MAGTQRCIEGRFQLRDKWRAWNQIALQLADLSDALHAVCQEDSLGCSQIPRRDAGLRRGEAGLRAIFQQPAACGAGQRAGGSGRCANRSASDPEEIAATGLADLAAVIEQKGVVGAKILGGGACEDVRQFVGALDAGERVLHQNPERGDGEADRL